MRPLTLECDWNRLYGEFPDVYAEFAAVKHPPHPVDVGAALVPLEGASVIDAAPAPATRRSSSPRAASA